MVRLLAPPIRSPLFPGRLRKMAAKAAFRLTLPTARTTRSAWLLSEMEAETDHGCNVVQPAAHRGAWHRRDHFFRERTGKVTSLETQGHQVVQFNLQSATNADDGSDLRGARQDNER